MAADGAAARARLWLCHGDPELLARWRPVAGAARLVDSTSIGRRSGGLDAWLQDLQAQGIDALNLHRREWSPARVEAVHAAGLRAFGWGAQTRREITRLLDDGVDGVYSDHVDVLMADPSAADEVRARPARQGVAGGPLDAGKLSDSGPRTGGIRRGVAGVGFPAGPLRASRGATRARPV